jgi:hypothetical protein
MKTSVEEGKGFGATNGSRAAQGDRPTICAGESMNLQIDDAAGHPQGFAPEAG